LRRYGTTLTKRAPRSAGKRSLGKGRAVSNSGFMIGSPVTSGILVTPATALNFVSVFCAVNTIATDLATLPLGPYRREGEGARVPAPEASGARLLANCPDPDSGDANAFRTRQATMGHVLLWGNGYLEIRRNGRGAPTGLTPLNPATTQPRRDDRTGKLYYHLIDVDRKLLPENVVHIAGLGFDGIAGFSVIHFCRGGVGLGIATENFGGSFFGNGATPSGILKTPRRLSPLARQNLRESIYQVHQGSLNANHLMILEEGLDYAPRTMPLEDAQFLATRQFQVLEVARMYRIPPHKLMDYSKGAQASVEEANRNYEETTLLGWATAIEAEVDNKLLFQTERDRGVFYHHNFGRLNRANTQVRTGYYQVMRNTGAMSADDIRAAEGLNPIGTEKGGDAYVIQGQYVPLDQIDRVHVDQAPARTDPESEGDPDDAPDE
jgi:HK97 family phage portal protein